jgi:hypothetical protein
MKGISGVGGVFHQLVGGGVRIVLLNSTSLIQPEICNSSTTITTINIRYLQ